MALRAFGLTVKQFPEALNVKQGKYFLADLLSHMNGERPFVVLDFSNGGLMDRPAITLLLCCLEETLKRNGDVKLAAIPEEARAILRLTGVERLFEIFDTEAEAISSFRRPPQDAAFHVDNPGSACRASEDTA